jgi:hypothetical protein
MAVLLAAPGVDVWRVATPEVLLGLAPSWVLVTPKVTVQFPLTGIVIPLKLKAVGATENMPNVPVQPQRKAIPT